MDPIIKTYTVKVIREPGNNLITGQMVQYEEQLFEVDAVSVQAAYKVSYLVCDIKFTGQVRRTIIDEQEYFNERY